MNGRPRSFESKQFMKLDGTSIIGYGRGSKTGATITAFDPSTGSSIQPDFHSATADELERAASFAEAARISYGKLPGKERARFLRAIADNIEGLGDALIERASLETALPNQRFVGERA